MPSGTPAPLGDLAHQSVNEAMPNAIQTHPQYDANDHAYLAAKGWTDQQILARWDQEASAGNGPCRWTAPQAASKFQSTIRSAT